MSSHTQQSTAPGSDRAEPDYIKTEPGQHGLGQNDMDGGPDPSSKKNGFDETDASSANLQQMMHELGIKEGEDDHSVQQTPQRSPESRKASVAPNDADSQPQQQKAPTPMHAAPSSPQFALKRLQELRTSEMPDSEYAEGGDTPAAGPAGTRQRIMSYIHEFPPSKYSNPQSKGGHYRPIEEHGLVGNMKTVAVIGTDAEVTYFSYPYFDSPSIFASILDCDIGGYWAIRSAVESHPDFQKVYGDQQLIHKQLYHSETNVLISRFLTESGVAQVQDYMPVGAGDSLAYADGWLVRELEVVRGKMYFEVECKPAFNYARTAHKVEMIDHGARFITEDLTMVLTCRRKYKWMLTADGKGIKAKIKLSEGQKTVFVFREETGMEHEREKHTTSSHSKSDLSKDEQYEHKYNEQKTQQSPDKQHPLSRQNSEAGSTSPAPSKPLHIRQSSKWGGFPSRTKHKEMEQAHLPVNHASQTGPPQRHEQLSATTTSYNASARKNKVPSSCHPLTSAQTEVLRKTTIDYWRGWLSKCTYKGRWREAIYRSVLVLKLLTFEPTGAIVAAPTTSLPEGVGGERNWDYRFTWIRDSSFTLYAFIKLGFRDEARAFMKWVEQRCREATAKGKGGELQIMYGIHGEHHLEEVTLDHLAGYKNSKPVRIGNGAFNQKQLDIYGELLDTIYLSNKYAEPVSYDLWCHVRVMVDWVTQHWTDQDEGIWEVRGGSNHFVYSKVMAWVAVDRGIRLAERRSFPADLPRWHQVRNTIYEEIQEKGWNEERKAYVQHYGSNTLDASVLIMPLVFFISPSDPRFRSTLDEILKSTAEDGLVSNNLVFRYNVESTDDGLTGEEGTFNMCTFWAVEAAARLGTYDKEYLEKARLMFEQMLGYANHLGLYSEEIGRRGEHLGNFPQAFTHLALISAALNLDRSMDSQRTA